MRKARIERVLVFNAVKFYQKKVDLMMPLDEEEFIRGVKRIFQNELQIELTRKVGVKP